MPKADPLEGTQARLQLWEVEVQRAGQEHPPTVKLPCSRRKSALGLAVRIFLWYLAGDSSSTALSWRCRGAGCPAGAPLAREGTPTSLAPLTEPSCFPLALRFSAERTRMVSVAFSPLVPQPMCAAGSGVVGELGSYSLE